jgi:hypothetical protein
MVREVTEERESENVGEPGPNSGLVKFAYSEKDIGFSEDSVPGFIIEGLVGGAITQVFQQLNFFNELWSDPKHEKHSHALVQAQALCIIAYKEAEQTVELMKPMKDATIAPKFRDYRKITQAFLNDLDKREKAMRKAKVVRNKAVVESVEAVTKWLSSATIVLSSYSKAKDRKAEVKQWQI